MENILTVGFLVEEGWEGRNKLYKLNFLSELTVELPQLKFKLLHVEKPEKEGENVRSKMKF